VRAAGRSQGTGGGAGAGAPSPSRSMTYAEKWKLTELLGELPDEEQGRAVQIVAERHAEIGGDGGDGGDLVEINIEALDDVTLWMLDRYVRSCEPHAQGALAQAHHAGDVARGAD